MVSVPVANSRLVQNALGITAGTLLNVFQSCRRQEPRGLSFGHQYLAPQDRSGAVRADVSRRTMESPVASVSIATSAAVARCGVCT